MPLDYIKIKSLSEIKLFLTINIIFEIRAMKCLVCGKAIDLEGAESKTGETAHGAKEIDPSKGTRQFHDGDWYYFDTLNCRSKFTISPQRYLTPKA